MISLQNEGLLELDFIKTMGIHVKDNENPIGFFGTGLKYAIAVFLRENIPFSLFIGNNLFKFYTESKTIRGKEFNYCYLQGPSDSIELNFTTDLGKNWDLWQAYREIHSNCLDENGDIVLDRLSPAQDRTTFVFEDIDERLDIASIFLHFEGRELLYSNSEVEIYEGESEYLYYQGIRAKDLYYKSMFTYNIKKKCDLTEDRLLCYDFQVKYIINDAIVELSKYQPEISAKVISAQDGFESHLDMANYTNLKPTDEFLDQFHEANKTESNVNYSVAKYVSSNTPKPELSPQEKQDEFVQQLEWLCEEYEVEVNKHNAIGVLSLELIGGILDLNKGD